MANSAAVSLNALAVAVSAYLAAVYVCDDARQRDLVAPYRHRALGARAVAGLLPVAGLVVLHGDAHPLYRGLMAGAGLRAVIASGVAALGLVFTWRFQLARYAAAPHETLVAVVVAVAAAGVVLLPALFLLLRLSIAGRLEDDAADDGAAGAAR
jgi:cytochrome d ubiquinol oxidase subunit II